VLTPRAVLLSACKIAAKTLD